MKDHCLGCPVLTCRTLVLGKNVTLTKPFYKKSLEIDSFPQPGTVMQGVTVQYLFWFGFYEVCLNLLRVDVWTNNGGGVKVKYKLFLKRNLPN